jgi:hypothetical protein
MGTILLVVASAACLLMVFCYVRYVLSLDEDNSDAIVAVPHMCGMPVILLKRASDQSARMPQTERTELNDE